MADISKVQLPGSTEQYNIKDATARSNYETLKNRVDNLQSAGLTMTIVTELPAIIDAKENVIYMIKHTHSTGNAGSDTYDEYIIVKDSQGTKSWEKIGNTDIDLSEYSKKTHTHTISGTTGSSGALAVTFTGGSTGDFITGISATTSKLVTASLTPAGAATSVNSASTTDVDVVTKVSVGSSKGAASKISSPTSTTFKAVNSVGSASTFNFSVASEILTISGANSTVPTTTNTTCLTGFTNTAVDIPTVSASTGKASKVTTTPVSVATVGTAVTVATGAVSANGTGSTIATGVSKTTGKAVTGIGTATAAAHTHSFGGTTSAANS